MVLINVHGVEREREHCRRSLGKQWLWMLLEKKNISRPRIPLFVARENKHTAKRVSHTQLCAKNTAESNRELRFDLCRAGIGFKIIVTQLKNAPQPSARSKQVRVRERRAMKAK